MFDFIEISSLKVYFFFFIPQSEPNQALETHPTYLPNAESNSIVADISEQKGYCFSW